MKIKLVQIIQTFNIKALNTRKLKYIEAIVT